MENLPNFRVSTSLYKLRYSKLVDGRMPTVEQCAQKRPKTPSFHFFVFIRQCSILYLSQSGEVPETMDSANSLYELESYQYFIYSVIML